MVRVNYSVLFTGPPTNPQKLGSPKLYHWPAYPLNVAVIFQSIGIYKFKDPYTSLGILSILHELTPGWTLWIFMYQDMSWSSTEYSNRSTELAQLGFYAIQIM